MYDIKGFACRIEIPLWEDKSPLPPFIYDKLISQNNGNAIIVRSQLKIHNKIILKMNQNKFFLFTDYLGLTK